MLKIWHAINFTKVIWFNYRQYIFDTFGLKRNHLWAVMINFNAKI